MNSHSTAQAWQDGLGTGNKEQFLHLQAVLQFLLFSLLSSLPLELDTQDFPIKVLL